jgi:hypothetical protein
MIAVVPDHSRSLLARIPEVSYDLGQKNAKAERER